MTARERASASEMVKERYAVVMVVRNAHRGGGDSKNLVKADRPTGVSAVSALGSLAGISRQVQPGASGKGSIWRPPACNTQPQLLQDIAMLSRFEGWQTASSVTQDASS